MRKIPANRKTAFLFFAYVFIVLILTRIIYLASVKCPECIHTEIVSLTQGSYGPEVSGSLWDTLRHRIEIQPFHLVTLFLFVGAVLHTFFAAKVHALSEYYREKNISPENPTGDSFTVQVLKFMGEVEVIFGIWAIPLLIAITLKYNWMTALDYLSGRDYTEPMFIIVIMSIASTKPIITMAEDCLKFFAKLGGESVFAWWLSILTLGPLAGSFITEPAAMAISAILLAKHFYSLSPSKMLAYGTLGLLFTNISVGGVLTAFAAPPVLMVSKTWDWNTSFMFFNFGIKAVLGIICANFIYFLYFRKELYALEIQRNEIKKAVPKEPEAISIPFWITLVHVTFMAWIVVHNHYPVMFIGTFLLFLGFYKTTREYQDPLSLYNPILVGFFLAGLIIHGSLQSWWITPVLSSMGCGQLMIVSTILTAFNDNAAITFLASLIPSFSDIMKYAVVAGAVTGGGLTVIANAPNPLGQALLGRFFPKGIRPGNLFMAALLPTLIMALSFWLFKLSDC